MIKFTDIIRANGKFWYVLVASIIICFGMIFGLTYTKNSYMASTTLTIEKNTNVEGATISSNEIDNHIKRINQKINSKEFIETLISNIDKKNTKLANNLSYEYVKSNLNMEFRSGENFFRISIKGSSEAEAALIINETKDLIKKEYEEKNPIESSNSKIDVLLKTQVEKIESKNVVYAIVGLLVGVVLAEIIITCILAFNPKVKDDKMLSRETELNILVKLDKVKGDK